jgi:hypothetical protein
MVPTTHFSLIASTKVAALNGSGIRDTARVLKLSPTTVINALQKKNRRSAV